MSIRYQSQWEFLTKKCESQNLSHAYIFSGRDTQGKKEIAMDLIKLAGQHQYDALIDAHHFPDLLVITSGTSASSVKNEKDMMEISIEQIRQAQHFLSYKSYYGGYKVVLIENAERMSTDAQDCFLKNLEEPKGKTLIILLCAAPEMLLPTIASRCQTISFLGNHMAAGALPKELADVMRLDLAEKFKYVKSANLDGERFNAILDAMTRYFRDLLLGSIGVIKAQENTYSTGALKKILRDIETISRQAATSNANAKLALEVLLMEI